LAIFDAEARVQAQPLRRPPVFDRSVGVPSTPLSLVLLCLAVYLTAILFLLSNR